jgi:hypothetical protein
MVQLNWEKEEGSKGEGKRKVHNICIEHGLWVQAVCNDENYSSKIIYTLFKLSVHSFSLNNCRNKALYHFPKE